jgi:hypothetical protein
MNDNDLQDPRQLPAYPRPKVAEMFNVSVNTINNWLNEGRFRTASGAPVAWQEKDGLKQWFIVAEAVHRLRGILNPPPATVLETDMDTITVYTVIYEDVNAQE